LSSAASKSLVNIPELLSIYHEILINEISIMRSNSIVEEGINIGDAIVYYSRDTIHNPDTNRGLDLLLLVYAIVNGLRRFECGYDIVKPIDPKGLSECRDKIREAIKEVVRKVEGSAPPYEDLEHLLVHLIVTLIKQGLIHIVLDTDSDARRTTSPLRALFTYKFSGNELTFNNIHTMSEIRLLGRLINFLREPNIDIDKLIRIFSNKVKELLNNQEIKPYEIMFKTLHGLLFMYVSHASALPTNPAVLEANVLPFIIEPLPFPEASSGRNLKDITCGEEDCIRKDILELLDNAVRGTIGSLSDFQFEYLKDAFKRWCDLIKQGRKGGLLIAITSPTGSGKTHIFLLYALAKIISGLTEKPRVLIIYPRKALARDQLEKMIKFINIVNKELSRKGARKITVGIYDGDSLKRTDKGGRSLRGLKIDSYHLCHEVDGGKYSVYISSDPECSNRVGEVDWIKDYHDNSILREADILVTNHSMLTKIISENFSQEPQNPVKEFLRDLRILIFDEAHIYLDESELEVLASTFLKLLYLHAKQKKAKYSDLYDLVSQLDMDIVISSATLSDVNLISKKVGDQEYIMDTKSIIGYFKIRLTDQRREMPDSLVNFLKALISEPVYERYNRVNSIIYHDYDAIIAKAVRQAGSWRGLFKLRIALVAHPYPHKESWTALAESLIAALHWVNAIRMRGISKRAQLLVFIDMKQTLKDFFEVFLERQILDALDHADRVLLTGKFDKSLMNNVERLKAIYPIVEYINNLCKNGKSIAGYHILYKDPSLGNFHVLHPYLTIDDLKTIFSQKFRSYDEMLYSIGVFSKLENVISSINSFAREMYSGIRDYETTVYEILKNRKYDYVWFIHHGDLNKSTRAYIESCMKGERDPAPLAVLATSTLEVGVDIDDLVAVIQYTSRPYSVELVQRMGRSGRSQASFYTSTLILILRNTGEDVRYIIDQEAVKYVYNFEIPRVREIFKDKEAIVRSITRLVVQNRDSEKLIEEFLNLLGGEYYDTYTLWKQKAIGRIDIDRKYPANIADIDKICEKIGKLKEFRELLIRLESELVKLDTLSESVRDSLRESVKDLVQSMSLVIEELERAKELLKAGLYPNLSPLIVRLNLVLDKLKSLRKELKRHMPSSDYIIEGFENAAAILYEKIQTIATIMRYTITSITKVDEKRAFVDVLSYIAPGMTDEIGRVNVKHYILSLSRGGKAESIEASEAFKRVRPLWTGAG
jgi:CRISPR/Cas system-associated endonuclease/helicase Cas3